MHMTLFQFRWLVSGIFFFFQICQKRHLHFVRFSLAGRISRFGYFHFTGNSIWRNYSKLYGLYIASAIVFVSVHSFSCYAISWLGLLPEPIAWKKVTRTSSKFASLSHTLSIWKAEPFHFELFRVCCAVSCSGSSWFYFFTQSLPFRLLFHWYAFIPKMTITSENNTYGTHIQMCGPFFDP